MSVATPSAVDDSKPLQVILTPEEFAEDLDLRLGRANGNIYHRREGKEGVHDGQVMVRLNKKRFIVIDYSIVPNDADLQHAAITPHIKCPPGAGKAVCITRECNKVGIPVLLYDSEPDESESLYLRSGLCFTCQRNLNEQRRNRSKKIAADGDAVKKENTGTTTAVSPGNKRSKLVHTDKPLDLSQSATVAFQNTQALLQAVNPSGVFQTNPPPPMSEDVARLYNHAIEKQEERQKVEFAMSQYEKIQTNLRLLREQVRDLESKSKKQSSVVSDLNDLKSDIAGLIKRKKELAKELGFE
jgi:hypothetical protein